MIDKYFADRASVRETSDAIEILLTTIKRAWNFAFQLPFRAGAFAERGLRCGEPRNRHAKRRARHVVERDLVAERDRGRIAAVLAADAELEIFADLAAARGGDADELADARAVDRDKRVGRQDAFRRIDAEKTCGVVAADAERGLRQII